MTIDDLDELSDAEIDTLESVWDSFGGMDQWDLVEFTHDTKNVPEWTDPKGQGSRKIPLESMMAAIGVAASNEHAAEIESVDSATGFFEGPLSLVCKAGTLLVPSGTRHTPDQKHLHIVCTDPDDQGQVVLVSVTTWTNDFCDDTCILLSTNTRGFGSRNLTSTTAKPIFTKWQRLNVA